MKSPQIHWIGSDDPPDSFPDTEQAFDVPNGLLAAGGDLSVARLLYAYAHGIFPWFEEGQPILWWSPDPRCVFLPGAPKVSKRSLRSIRRAGFTATVNAAFGEVVSGCAEKRPGQRGTWITAGMSAAYSALHDAGWAHSIEIRADGALVGGLYGVAIGEAFFGESMFSRVTEASKAALLVLCRILWSSGFRLFDAQVASPHLLGLGAELLPRRRFTGMLADACGERRPFDAWPAAPVDVAELVTSMQQTELQ